MPSRMAGWSFDLISHVYTEERPICQASKPIIQNIHRTTDEAMHKGSCQTSFVLHTLAYAASTAWGGGDLRTSTIATLSENVAKLICQGHLQCLVSVNSQACRRGLIAHRYFCYAIYVVPCHLYQIFFSFYKRTFFLPIF